MNKQIFVAKKSFFLSNCSSAWQVSLEISGGTARDYLHCARLFALRAIICASRDYLHFVRLFCASCDYFALRAIILRCVRLFCTSCDYLRFVRLFALRAVWPCHSRCWCVISWTTWRARSQPSPFADGVAAGRVIVADGVAAGRVIVAVGV